MSPIRRNGARLVAAAAIAALVASACNSKPAKPTPALTPSGAVAPAAGVTVVRWFVGLGKGNDANQVTEEKAVVRAYNASQAKIFVNLEVIPSASAHDTLQSEIANGTAPDIVGPVSIRGLNGFSGDFIDLSPEIASSGYDMAKYPSAVVEYLKQGSAGQIGLPYLISPGFIFYNKDVFTKANLPDLPKHVGDQWNGKDWTWDTLAGVAALLTIDKKGKKSTDVGFDPANVAQYGFDFPWSDPLRVGSCFASGSLVGADGTAAIPDAWVAAWTWYYNAIWKSHVAPTAKVIASPLLRNGSTVSSGNVAMAVSWPWAIPTYGSADAIGHSTAKFGSWDMAVMPSYEGQVSSPLDVDTFAITRASEYPMEAFKAMTAIMADTDLQAAYGGMPAATADQQAWFDQSDRTLAGPFPGNSVSWSVLQEMENYPANPSPDADVPNYQKVASLTAGFYAKLQSSAKFDVVAETANLRNQIEKAFQQASNSPNP